MVIKSKYSLALIVVIATVAGIFIINNFDKPKEVSGALHKAIASEDVAEVKMAEWVLDGATWKQKDVDLNQEEINQIRSLFNSVPADRIRNVQEVNPNLHAGIVFGLKQNSEVRIQYDKKDVYVTRTGRTGQVKYIVDYPEIKQFFDKQSM